MAGASIEITVDDAELNAALRRLQAKLGDLKPFFADVGEQLLNSTRERFRAQTAPDGAPWAPLSPAYAARKKKNKNKILTLDGRLRGTLTKQVDQDSLRIGTPLAYGATHQFGARKGQFGAVVAQINAYVRRVKSRDVKQGRKTVAKGVAFVRAHSRKMIVPWGNIPARPFLGLSDRDRADLLDALNEYLARD
ncbi:MAG: phage virion morphogenesis protein [Candidatus Competibacter sp.]|nr:phage virion morphogenesis protein [Candidatus Competibacter sp.]MDS4059830.1 phage virion morphogenesis protein [Candidatus Contendobacter sp.]